MTVNAINLELELAKRIGTSTEEEILILTKSFEKLASMPVVVVDHFDNLPSASESAGTLCYVLQDDVAYFPDVDNDIWISIKSEINGFLSPVGANSGTLSIKYAGNTGNYGLFDDSALPTLKNGAYKKVKFAFDTSYNNTTFIFLKYDGTINSFGSNIDGTTGINYDLGQTSSSGSGGYPALTPVQEISLSINWTDLSANTRSVIALKSDGTLWGWGYNSFGELGVNDNSSRLSPVQETSSSTTWALISSGNNHSAAIKTDGTLWCWGRNQLGQLGTNNVTCYSSPVQETSSSTNWASVSCGSAHTVAIKTDGTLWSWGYNLYGNLGTNNTTSYSSPVQETSSSTDWAILPQEMPAASSTVAIKTDGTLWSWGYNQFGSLGTGDVVSYSSPVQEVSSSTNWASVSTHFRATGAIKTDGTLWSWGENNTRDELRHGDTINKSSPVQEIESLTTWLDVSVAREHLFAIRGDSNYRV